MATEGVGLKSLLRRFTSRIWPTVVAFLLVAAVGGSLVFRWQHQIDRRIQAAWTTSPILPDWLLAVAPNHNAVIREGYIFGLDDLYTSPFGVSRGQVCALIPISVAISDYDQDVRLIVNGAGGVSFPFPFGGPARKSYFLPLRTLTSATEASCNWTANWDPGSVCESVAVCWYFIRLPPATYLAQIEMDGWTPYEWVFKVEN